MRPRSLGTASPAISSGVDLPPPVLAAAARASREQIAIARAAAEIESWLRGEGRQAVDVERLLAFVAQVRLSSALTGGELTEILLLDPLIGQTDGGWRPTSADAASDHD